MMEAGEMQTGDSDGYPRLSAPCSTSECKPSNLLIVGPMSVSLWRWKAELVPILCVQLLLHLIGCSSRQSHSVLVWALTLGSLTSCGAAATRFATSARVGIFPSAQLSELQPFPSCLRAQTPAKTVKTSSGVYPSVAEHELI